MGRKPISTSEEGEKGNTRRAPLRTKKKKRRAAHIVNYGGMHGFLNGLKKERTGESFGEDEPRMGEEKEEDKIHWKTR